MQKGFYPYVYLMDVKKFKAKLPSKEKFYSSLICKNISDREYVWNKFERKIMQHYDNLYLKCDILLVGDVFEKI